MKLKEKRTYTTTQFEVEMGGMLYNIIHEDDFDGEWVMEWYVEDEDGHKPEDDVEGMLINFCKELL